jgi:hypothetical protein
MSAIVPTLLVRDTEQNRRIYADLCESDPDNAEREFNCVALSIGATDFFDPVALQECVDKMLPALNPIYGQQTSFAGLDTGFKRDASAIVITRTEPTLNNRLLVSECFERPAEKEGSSPKAVLSEFRVKLDAHKCRMVACDQHYVMTVKDELPGFGINECPATQEFKYSSHCYVRDLIRARGIVIPAAHKKLLAQLRDIQVVPTPGGGMKLTSPRYGGAHGDLASAFALAVWAANPSSSIDWSQFDRMRQLQPKWSY